MGSTSRTERAVAESGGGGLWRLVRRSGLGPAGFGILGALAELAGPWCLVQAIDLGIAARDWVALSVWLGGMALAYILAGVLRYVGRCRILKIGLDLERRCMNRLFGCVMHADIRALPETMQGEYMGQILLAASNERAFVEMMYAQGVPLATTAVGSFAVLLTLSWPLAVVCLGCFPFAALLWRWMRRQIRPAARCEYESREGVYRIIAEVFGALVPIRALRREDKFCRRFEEQSSWCQETGYALGRKMAIQGPFFDFLQATVLVAVFGVGGIEVMSGDASVGVLLGFQVYLARLFGLMRSGTGLFGAYQHFIEGSARARDIERLPQAEGGTFGVCVWPEVLRIDHLTFSFGARVVWDDFSLVLREGEKHAILLPSGRGKTTLARCILGLYPVSRGTVSLPSGTPDGVGFVPQENALFDGTLYDNVSIMCEDLDQASYKRLLTVCGLEGVAGRLGDQALGERGGKLSGGEQRRVMLARALANSPRLLIIDQMASELEPELCRTIFERIQSCYPSMAILYLGHRLPEWG